MAWQFVAAGTVATGANPTPALPTGWAQGDLLVFVASSSASYGANNPSGYTNLVKNTAASPFFSVWYKTAGSSESAVSVTNANTTSKAVVLAYRYVGALDVTGTLVTGSTTATTTTTVTTTGRNSLVLNLYGAGVTGSSTGSWSGGSANSRVSSGTSTSLSGVYCTDELQAAAGATTARTGTISRASTGTQGVTIAFTSAALTTTGALTGPGSTVVGSANRYITHTATGALTGPGSTVSGSANYNANHGTSGSLNGPGAVVLGYAQNNVGIPGGVWDTTRWSESRWVGTIHSTNGTLPGQTAAITGTAAHAAGHPTSGALVGPGSSVTGAASRTHVFSSTGVLVAQGAVVTGDASRVHVFDSSGALVGPGSLVDGTAARLRAFGSSGALVGPGSEVVGSAERLRQFSSSGDLVGPGAIVDGAAERIVPGAAHITTGDIVGDGAIVVGEAELTPIAVTHDTTGDLVGPGSIVSGQAQSTGSFVPVIADIGPGDEKKRKKREADREREFEKERQERDVLRQQIKRAIEPVAEKAEPVVVSEGERSIQVLSVDGSRVGIKVPEAFDAAEVAKIVAEVLEAAQVQARYVQSKQDAKRALAIARAEVARIIKRKREEEFLLLLD